VCGWVCQVERERGQEASPSPMCCQQCTCWPNQECALTPGLLPGTGSATGSAYTGQIRGTGGRGRLVSGVRLCRPRLVSCLVNVSTHPPTNPKLNICPTAQHHVIITSTRTLPKLKGSFPTCLCYPWPPLVAPPFEQDTPDCRACHKPHAPWISPPPSSLLTTASTSPFLTTPTHSHSSLVLQ